MSEERTLKEQCYGTCWAACERIDELEQERASLRAEVERLRGCEAVCHCGLTYSKHGSTSSEGHSFVEQKELCPHAEQVIELRAERDTLAARVGELEKHLHNVLRIVDRFSEEICTHEAERYESAVAAMKEAE